RRRLDEGREALGRRLRQRGSLPGALSAVLLSDCTAPQAPAGLIRGAAQVALSVTTGQAPGVSAKVVALATGLQIATSSSIRFAMAIFLGASLLVGVGVSAYHTSTDSPPRQQSNKPARQATLNPTQAPAGAQDA